MVFEISLVLALLFAPGASDVVDSQLKSFVDLFATVAENAADPVDKETAFYGGAIPGMLRRLDPHTVFFDPKQFEQLKELENSTRKGFGSVVSILPGRVIVLQTLPNTPSARSGINPGDEVIAINGILLNRLEVEQLVGLLSQSRQSQVRLDVRRQGNARVLQFLLTPEDVDAPSVERAFELRPGVGYVRAGSFDVQTGKHLREAIEKLGGAKLQGLVLDLRNNPGGVLPAAIETASLFLNPGAKVLSIKGRSVKDQDVAIPSGTQPYSFRLAIVVNAKSASASEIIAGSMQDHKRGIVVGEPTFGKGLVQSVYPLSQGTGLALTTAFYYTPEGRSIQRHLEGQLDRATTRDGKGGIVPDRIVYPDAVTPLRVALEATGSFTTFATGYIGRHAPIPADLAITSAILDEFQSAMSARNIRPSISEWSKERDWIGHRLKQEIFNQALGVAKGDEVEAVFDPQIQAALAELTAK